MKCMLGSTTTASSTPGRSAIFRVMMPMPAADLEDARVLDVGCAGEELLP